MDSNTRNGNTRAIITGGAQGLGLAIAHQLAEEGAQALVLIGRSEEKGRAAVAAIEALGAEAHFISAELSDIDACQRAGAQALERLGTVNALVNAAATSARGTLVDTTPALFDRIFATNVRAPFFLMQAVVAHLLNSGSTGSIVNVLSMAAHGGASYLSPYAASKGALATLTRNAAHAYRGSRIRVNAVLPGWMDTPGETVVQQTFHDAGENWLAEAEAGQPMGQLVKPDQLAMLVAYMISPQSGVMTGALVDYDQTVVGAAD
ncbi:SDR family oxidoreductase [Mesorhizobium sp. RP14(2022)]|uniref:SDR family oxidoreductase n=1 Tax=Mesorhizobium liriopis TaxID=2953882 RepID=A0ABT1C4A2_9HYPH|nr:SDR family oxidoreductase [Mesorhizobium liriopis]MCO6049040.1 SDR family oxidoreductase [Mesorhizobium liriopis]